MAVGDVIKRLRLSHKLSQSELGKIAGVTDKAVSTWEKGEKVPRMGSIEKMATYFGVSKGYLIDGEPIEGKGIIPPGFAPLPPMACVPLVGRIACGDPITAEENVEDIVSIPTEWNADFTLMCRGNSMAPKILDGDLVAIRIQPEVENGEIAVVRIENEATLKRVYLHKDYIELRPENTSFESIIRRRDEMNDVHIEGKAVGICRGI